MPARRGAVRPVPAPRTSVRRQLLSDPTDALPDLVDLPDLDDPAPDRDPDLPADISEFDISIPFQDPIPDVDPVRAPLIPPVPHDISLDDGVCQPVYGFMTEGTQRNKVLLYDSIGYTYTKKSAPIPRSGKVTWRCSVRNGAKGGAQCNAKVWQVWNYCK